MVELSAALHLRRALAAEAEVRTRQQRDLFRPLEAYHASLGFYLLATLSAPLLRRSSLSRALALAAVAAALASE